MKYFDTWDFYNNFIITGYFYLLKQLSVSKKRIIFNKKFFIENLYYAAK